MFYLLPFSLFGRLRMPEPEAGMFCHSER